MNVTFLLFGSSDEDSVFITPPAKKQRQTIDYSDSISDTSLGPSINDSTCPPVSMSSHPLLVYAFSSKQPDDYSTLKVIIYARVTVLNILLRKMYGQHYCKN